MTMADTRRGEKIGWLGGFAGGFLGIPALAVVFLVQGDLLAGLVGIALGVLGYGTVVRFRPWRYPDTPYWRLLIPPYLALIAAVVWGFWAYGAEAAADRSWWEIMQLLVLFLPFVTVGKRCWRDGEQAGGQGQ